MDLPQVSERTRGVPLRVGAFTLQRFEFRREPLAAEARAWDAMPWGDAVVICCGKMWPFQVAQLHVLCWSLLMLQNCEFGWCLSCLSPAHFSGEMLHVCGCIPEFFPRKFGQIGLCQRSFRSLAKNRNGSPTTATRLLGLARIQLVTLQRESDKTGYNNWQHPEFPGCNHPPALTGWNAFLPEGEVNVAVGYQQVVQKLLPNYGGSQPPTGFEPLRSRMIEAYNDDNGHWPNIWDHFGWDHNLLVGGGVKHPCVKPTPTTPKVRMRCSSGRNSCPNCGPCRMPPGCSLCRRFGCAGCNVAFYLGGFTVRLVRTVMWWM